MTHARALDEIARVTRALRAAGSATEVIAAIDEAERLRARQATLFASAHRLHEVLAVRDALLGCSAAKLDCAHRGMEILAPQVAALGAPWTDLFRQLADAPRPADAYAEIVRACDAQLEGRS